MPIPAPHRTRCVYHFTHISNLPGLLRTGFLANNHPNFPTNSHRSIAASGIQARRAGMQVTCGPGGFVHDYVPLYFGSISPMLLGVINAKNVDQMDILYFEFPITLVTSAGAVFTDASANTAIPPNFYNDPSDLVKLDWTAIDSKSWNTQDNTFRHKRMAELLIHHLLPVASASRCVVWNEDIQAEVKRIVANANAAYPPIEFESSDRRHFFCSFFKRGHETCSLVTGPREIAMTFEAACKEIEKDRGKHAATAAFANTTELLANLRVNFGCLSYTAELVGLKSENAVHTETVDVHTKEVVAKLLALDEYDALTKLQKTTIELAAYLHDIGKGPRSRWDDNDGLQKVDPNHPVGAMPMMVDILTNHVGKESQVTVELLTKLVCYHDLVGDVLGKGRDEQQIIDVANDQGELDLLFALGKADATTLNPFWWDKKKAEALYDRCLSAIEDRAA